MGWLFFLGNVSKVEGQADLQLWVIEPPKPLKSRIYRCDKEFVLDPLREIADDKIVFGLVVMDKREGNVAFLKGKQLFLSKKCTVQFLVNTKQEDNLHNDLQD